MLKKLVIGYLAIGLAAAGFSTPAASYVVVDVSDWDYEGEDSTDSRVEEVADVPLSTEANEELEEELSLGVDYSNQKDTSVTKESVEESTEENTEVSSNEVVEQEGKKSGVFAIVAISIVAIAILVAVVRYRRR